MDETIAVLVYRTGRGDRAIPFGIFLLTVLVAPAMVWGSGPFWWPWGLATAAAVALLGAAAFYRWWRALETVLWDEGRGQLVFCRRRRRVVELKGVEAIRVVPSEARTIVVSGGRSYVLSHRLVRVEHLLDRLRLCRPDLFPSCPPEFSSSATPFVVLGLLAGGTALAGAFLWPWQELVGLAFVGCGVLVAVRALWFVPRSFEVLPGALVVRFVLRRRTWRRPTAVQTDDYAAGGVQFFRMRLDFDSRSVVLDESVLTVPLRPWADWVTEQLVPLSAP